LPSDNPIQLNAIKTNLKNESIGGLLQSIEKDKVVEKEFLK